MENIEKQLRVLVDAAGRIMAAAEEDRETAAQAVKVLAYLEGRLQNRLDAIPRVVAQAMDNLAASTADKAAGLLTQNFEYANRAAADVTALYQQASAELRKGRLRCLMGFQAALFILQLGMLVFALITK